MRPIRSLFLAGTDTGVGKTTLAEGLLRLAQRRGLDIVPYKPAESGAPTAGGPDALRLLHAAGNPVLTAEMISPYRLVRPLAPSLAARLESRAVSEKTMVAGARRLLSSHSAILVESAGGLLSPYAPSCTPASLARTLASQTDLDVLLVAANRLGAINQCALASLALSHHDLPCLGIVLVQTLPQPSEAGDFNPGEIAAATNLPVLGTLSFLPAAANDVEATADAVLREVDVRPLFSGRLLG